MADNSNPEKSATPVEAMRRRPLDLRKALNAISDVVQNRPLPIREFDQIYMKIGDMVVYAEYLCRKLHDRKLVLVGDGDAIGLSMAYLLHAGVLDYGPDEILLLDFDERMVNSVKRFASENGFDSRITSRLYNVADPLPEELLGTFGAFHINPPWGQYNDGRSVVSFLKRGAQLLATGGLGVVAIADDVNAQWASSVLATTQRAALDHGLVVVEMQPNMHTYHLDDAPELASCALTFRLHENTKIANAALTQDEMRDFYGRGRDLTVRHVREIPAIARGSAAPHEYEIVPM